MNDQVTNPTPTDAGAEPTHTMDDAQIAAAFTALAEEDISEAADDSGSAPAPTSAPASTEPAAPAASTAAQPPAAPQPPAVTGEPPAPPAAPASEPAAPAASSGEQLSWDDWRNQQMAAIAESYKLTDEQLLEIQDNPAKAIPNLLAKVFADAVQAASINMYARLPEYMAAQNEMTRLAKEAEERFFGKYPELKQYHKEIEPLAIRYRQMMPEASEEELGAQVAAHMAILKRVPIGQQPPAAPAAETNPFVPAQGGGAQVLGAAPRKSDNPITQLAEELLAEDQ